MARSLKILGLNYPGLQAKLWKIQSQHLKKVFAPPQKQYPRPIKTSSGGSGTQEHWPSSRLPRSHQDVIVPRFRTEESWLGRPAAAPDAPSPEAGWRRGAAGPQLPITVQRTCRTFPCSQWGCGARARLMKGRTAADGWAARRPGV